MGIHRPTEGGKSTRYETKKDETTKLKEMTEKKSETAIKMEFSRFSYSQGDSLRRDCLETIDNNRFISVYRPKSEDEGLVGLQFLASWDSNSSQQTSEDWDALSADEDEGHLENSDKRDDIDMNSVSGLKQSPSSTNVTNMVPQYQVLRETI